MNSYNEQYKDCDDEKLMNLIKQGKNSAFDELYNRYSKRLLYFFFRMLGRDEQTAQDFLQEIFLKIVDKPHLFKKEKRFSSWIYAVASNMCKSEYRRRNVRKNTRNLPEIETVSIDTRDEEHTIEKKYDQKKFKNVLSVELENINEDQKTVFLLRYQENFSIKEVSKIINCSEGTVKSRLFYAAKKLAEKLKEFNPNQTNWGTL